MKTSGSAIPRRPSSRNTGIPYTQEVELIDGKTIETLGYKESMLYGYKINTYFVFEDGKLIKKHQSEERPRPEIKVEKE